MTKEQLTKSASKGHALYCKMMDAGMFDDRSLGGVIDKPKKKISEVSMRFRNRSKNPRWKQIQMEAPFKPISGRDWLPR